MLRLSLFSFVVLVAHLFAAPAPIVPKRPSPKVLNEWLNAGVHVVAESEFSGFIIADGDYWPKNGGRLVFVVSSCEKDVLEKLPDPEIPFRVRIQASDTNPDELLAGLKHFKNLEGIELRGNAKGIGLIKLVHIDQLKYLSLHDTECDDETLKIVSKFTNLEELHLGKCKISDLCAPSLAKLKKLKQLHLEETCVGDDVLETISKHNDLIHLSIQRTLVTDEGLKSVSRLDSLEFLSLGTKRKFDTGVKHLSKLKNLKELDYQDETAPDDLLEAISKCSKIEKFSLQVFEHPKGFHHLANLKKMRRCRLHGTPITANDFKALMELESLKHILCYSDAINDDAIVGISKLKNLDFLCLPRAKFTTKSLPELSKLEKLTDFFFNRSELSEEDLTKFKKSLPRCFAPSR